jgi:ribosome-associated protein
MEKLVRREKMENTAKTFKIPPQEIILEDFRSPGPGGQKANKTATGRRVRWNFESSNQLTKEEKERLRRKIPAGYLTKKGEIIVRATSARSQKMNTRLAIERLEEIVTNALKTPKKRRPTKPSKAAKEKRLKQKKITSRKKLLRRKLTTTTESNHW